MCDGRRSTRQHHRFPDPAGGRGWCFPRLSL
nr:MAG TPA: Albumin I chain a [Caudoviricetes sp.]